MAHLQGFLLRIVDCFLVVSPSLLPPLSVGNATRRIEMTSLRLMLIAVPFVVAGAACSQSGPSAGGMGGAAGGGTGGSTAITVDQITGTPNAMGDKLSNSWMMFPCYAQQGQDCITIASGACPNQNAALPFEQQGLVFDQSFDIGGTPGTIYNMTIQVNGITEGKYYQGGVRHGGDAAPANPDLETGIDTFYTGGSPVNVENYNVYKLTTLDNAGQELQHYYLNSMPSGTGPNFENHDTFPEGYTAVIPVTGGGKVSYHEADRNCHAVDNCGIGSRSVSCVPEAGRNIPNEPSVVIPASFLGMPMGGFNLRNGASQPFHAQIMHITVTAVEIAPTP
jgi:hypothetical protein